MSYVSRAMFGLAALVLMLLSLGMILQGIYQPFAAFRRSTDEGSMALLIGVGYVIIAIAVFDVAKFLVEEEVLQNSEKRKPSEARRSLTSFISTIAIAVFLEALVTVFRVSHDRVPEMIYPTLLLVAGTGLVLGLGVYQRLSVTVEREVEEGASDDVAERQRRG